MHDDARSDSLIQREQAAIDAALLAFLGNFPNHYSPDSSEWSLDSYRVLMRRAIAAYFDAVGAVG